MPLAGFYHQALVVGPEQANFGRQPTTREDIAHLRTDLLLVRIGERNDSRPSPGEGYPQQPFVIAHGQ